MAQTDAVIKSTGRAANVTAKDVEALAAEIMNYSGMSDDVFEAERDDEIEQLLRHGYVTEVKRRKTRGEVKS